MIGSESDPPALTGRVVSHYEVFEQLGRGGMGVVYKARDLHLNRWAALKVLSPGAPADAEHNARFHQEAIAASALNHPNIVTIHDIDTCDGIEFIAMEYVAGETLDEAIGKGRLPWRQAVAYASQIAGALVAAHAAGLTHRDLKPGNVMITGGGAVKVLDFGLAKLSPHAEIGDLASTQTNYPERGPKTARGAVLGTFAYMSPEQAEGKQVDARSDIFSFGVLLYEMVTGHRAFQRESKMSTLAALLRDDPTPVREVVHAVPAELEKIVARCIRKDPERRYQHMDDVRLALEEVKDEAQSASRGPRGRLAAAGIAAALLAVLGTAVWKLHSPAAGEAPRKLTRLTSDAGLTTDPAISPDGKLLAYASDRAGGGTLDIWLQQVAGGDPVRLTTDESDDYAPTFSPDATRIAFRSERAGGGIYVVSTLAGGEPRLVARRGRNPHFSPHGDLLAYWVGEPHWGSGTELYVVRPGGEAPRRIRPDFADARYPVWSPDGRSLLFAGTGPGGRDWWVTPLEGGKAVKTGAYGVLRRQQFTPLVSTANILAAPGIWEEAGVVFSGGMGDTFNLWRIPISPAGFQAGEAARRLTFGTGWEAQPAGAADGRLVFSSHSQTVDIWSLPADIDQGKPSGERVRLTEGIARDVQPSVSIDGRTVVFRSNRSGSDAVWLKDFPSGRETQLTTSPIDGFPPVISPQGGKVAFRAGGTIRVIPASGGSAESICASCGRLWHWSHDETRLLIQGTDASRLDILHVPTGQRREIIAHQFDVFEARFSADGGWIVFHVSTRGGGRRIYVAPVRERGSIPQSAWIAVTGDQQTDRNACWSPDGSRLYFLSDRDGFRCIWSQKLDPATKAPMGGPTAVLHVHHARHSLMSGANPHDIGLSAARDKLVFSMLETAGNIWTLEPERGE